ncbi:hypothetical protein WJX81_008112 [Elliptochloris bilobata]|uniref:Uncharacterized protein n=1 Tax=Elliptochloris bilobata TaxID=381761 RepID=A0AAW1S855_9CHLO
MQLLLALSCVVLLSTLVRLEVSWDGADSVAASAPKADLTAPGPVLVSYSYFEKDDIQRANLEFFLAVGMGISSGFQIPEATDFVLVVSGEVCSPCQPMKPHLRPDAVASKMPGLRGGWSGEGLALLLRKENEGMDFAAHNVTLDWAQRKRVVRRYRYFMFLNSSVRGPFYPSYQPAGWSWPRAFTDRLSADVKVVASSIVCLPEVDAGGFGPKVESWAFALDAKGLDLLMNAGVFHLRTCKLCDDGIVVKGEYGLSETLLGAGYNLATLMARYAPDTDWREKRHWHCNNNAHPSRHGTYDNISMHPFETVFIKASWHVGEPHLSHYSSWFLGRADGAANTGGTFDERMYRYAIQPQAQEPNNAAECFKVAA